MRLTPLGHFGIAGSAIRFGCMGMSEFYDETDDVESLKTLERGFEFSITLYDTSTVYGYAHKKTGVALLEQARDPAMLVVAETMVEMQCLI